MIRTLLSTLILVAGAAQAQTPPHAPGHPPPPGAPSPEALAAVPDLDAAKQAEVRRILIQRRDAHDALRAKEDAERRALMTRSRAEHERIDDESSTRMRKLLGDDGYRAFAAWLVSQDRPGHSPARMRRDGPPPVGSIVPPAPAPLGPDPDDADAEARVR